MKTEVISFRIDPEIDEEISKIAKKREIKKSDLIREIVQTKLYADQEDQHPLIISFLNNFVKKYREEYGVEIEKTAAIELALNESIARRMAYMKVTGKTKKDEPLMVWKQDSKHEPARLVRGKEHFQFLFDYWQKKYKEQQQLSD